MDNSKTCYKCGEKKPLNDFHRRTKAKDGHQNMCKSCNSDWVRGRYAKNKEAHYASVKRSRAIRKIKLLDLMIGKKIETGCIDCGLSDPRALDFDHIYGKKIMAVSHLVQKGVSEQKILDEIDKCVVRCANCHRIKTAIDFNHRSNDARWQSGNVPDC